MSFLYQGPDLREAGIMGLHRKPGEPASGPGDVEGRRQEQEEDFARVSQRSTPVSCQLLACPGLPRRTRVGD